MSRKIREPEPRSAGRWAHGGNFGGDLGGAPQQGGLPWRPESEGEPMKRSDGKGAGARTQQPPPVSKPPRDKGHLDELLDEALDETFPASDAIELTPEKD